MANLRGLNPLCKSKFSTSSRVAGECWANVLKEKANTPAVFNTRGESLYRFSDLNRLAQQFSKQLETHTVKGRVVSVCLPNSPEWPAILLACWLADSIPLLLPQVSHQGDSIEKRAGACARILQSASGIETLPLPYPAAPSPSSPHLLKVTSGTSGSPQCIGFHLSHLLADSKQICSTMKITPEDRNFGAIPFSHSYGLSNLITPLLFSGVPLIVCTDTVPRALAKALTGSNATIFPGLPAFFSNLSSLGSCKFPRLRTCISAGSPLPQKIARDFYRQFQIQIHSFYGSSECGGICYDRTGAAEHEEGWVGAPLDGVSVSMLQTEIDEAFPIEVRSPAVSLGYFPDDPGDNIQNGTFYPPDLLKKEGSGFRIVGRKSEIINLAGKKAHPSTIENAFLSIDPVRAVVAFGVPSNSPRGEEIVALVEAPGETPESLRQQLHNRIPDWQIPRRIQVMEKLPLDERGKISRASLVEIFLGNSGL